MSETPTWMIDGKPGLVLGALKAAQEQADSVGKQKADNMTYQAADETIAVATRALLAAGATYQCVLRDPLLEDLATSGCHVMVRATLHVIHPLDGSFTVSTSSSTALVNKFGKYTAAANTGARKQVWLTALGITTGETDKQHEPAEEMPESVEFLIAELEATQSRDELREVCCTEEYKKVRGKWRSVLRQCGREQERRLIRLGERRGTGPAVDPGEFSTKPKR